MVDESLALGVLGRHGRGACEHWGLQPGDAEIVSASMGVHTHPSSISLASADLWAIALGWLETMIHQIPRPSSENPTSVPNPSQATS